MVAVFVVGVIAESLAVTVSRLAPGTSPLTAACQKYSAASGAGKVLIAPTTTPAGTVICSCASLSTVPPMTTAFVTVTPGNGSRVRAGGVVSGTRDDVTFMP